MIRSSKKYSSAISLESKGIVQVALVAGGSKGIGYAIAEALAKRNYNLVLIGRHSEALLKAKESLELSYHIEVKIIEIDLALPGSAEEIAAWCQREQLTLKILCNVAGLGGKMDYLSLSLKDLRNMVLLNISAQMALCFSLLPFLKKAAPSYILNVASMAGFAPIPEKNMYSATKAAVIFFSYSLRYQLKGMGISVSCLCPGPVFTKPEIKEDTIEKLGRFGKWLAVEPSAVGEIGIKNTLNGKMIIIPGVLPKIMSVVLRFVPRRVIAYMYFVVGEKRD